MSERQARRDLGNLVDGGWLERESASLEHADSELAARGDIISAKQGVAKLLGYGIVEGDYEFDRTRTHSRHVRKVKWQTKGEWEMPEESKMALKTLTALSALYPASTDEKRWVDGVLARKKGLGF